MQGHTDLIPEDLQNIGIFEESEQMRHFREITEFIARERDFRLPTGMDYSVQGFHLGFANSQEREETPTYDAPAAAPEGFTRSPQEGDVLVCPNCDDELCVGDDDKKKQVWIVRGCGHVSF
jgi:hypothetical protein